LKKNKNNNQSKVSSSRGNTEGESPTFMFGKKIKELREKKGISITELAARSGVSKSYLSNIERDLKNNPSIEVLTKISSVLGEDTYEVIGMDNELQIDNEWIQFIKDAEDAGIDKEHLNEYRELIEFIKWRSRNKDSEGI
jgi:XRE family transcriptional regulator, master regulator for biofilm formation